MTSDADKGDIYFNDFDERYVPPTEIKATFTIVRFAPSKNDWIGLFDANDTEITSPVACQWFPVERFSEDDISLPWTSSVIFSIDPSKLKDCQSRKCEVRYINASDTVVARGQVFCLEASKSCQAKKDDLGEKKFSIINLDDWTGSSHRLPSKSSSDGELSISSSFHGDSSSIMLEREQRLSAESKMEEMKRTVALQIKLMDRNQEELSKLKIGYDREKTLKEALKEEIYVDSASRDCEIEDLRNVALTYKKEYQRVQALQESNDDLIDSLKCKIMEDKEMHIIEIDKLKTSYEKSLADYEKGLKEMESKVTSKESKVNDLQDTIGELNLKITNLEAFKSEVDSLKEKIVELESGIEKEKSNHKDVTDEYDRITQELESRLANESSRASKLENDIRITENRMQKAEADANYFNTLQKEQTRRLQETESILSKTREELLNIKNSEVSNCHSLNDSVSIMKCSVTDAGTSTELDVDKDEDNIKVIKRLNCSDALKTVDKNLRNNILDKQSAELFLLGSGKNLQADHNQKVNSNQRQDKTNQGSNMAITIVGNHTPKKSYHPTNQFSGQDNNPKFRKTEHDHDFSADITTLDRGTLEKQYSAIRLHRNALIREKSFLLNKMKQNGQDLVFLKTVLQNVILEAEHKIGMLQATIFNYGMDNTEEEFDKASSQQTLATTSNTEHESTPTKTKRSATECPLSPFATEYIPNASVVQMQNNNQFVTAAPFTGNYYGMVPQVDATYHFQQVVSGSYPCYSAPFPLPLVDYGVGAMNLPKR